MIFPYTAVRLASLPAQTSLSLPTHVAIGAYMERLHTDTMHTRPARPIIQR